MVLSAKKKLSIFEYEPTERFSTLDGHIIYPKQSSSNFTLEIPHSPSPYPNKKIFIKKNLRIERDGKVFHK